MPARYENFPWPSHYGNFSFFEGRMDEHSQVQEFTAISDGVYDVVRPSGEILRVFICECYSYGMAEYQESVDKLGTLNAIVINSNWCGYTSELKKYCRDNKVGLFTIGGFMAALNMQKYWQYLSEQEKEQFKNRGWT